MHKTALDILRTLPLDLDSATNSWMLDRGLGPSTSGYICCQQAHQVGEPLNIISSLCCVGKRDSNFWRMLSIFALPTLPWTVPYCTVSEVSSCASPLSGRRLRMALSKRVNTGALSKRLAGDDTDVDDAGVGGKRSERNWVNVSAAPFSASVVLGAASNLLAMLHNASSRSVTRRWRFCLLSCEGWAMLLLALCSWH